MQILYEGKSVSWSQSRERGGIITNIAINEIAFEYFRQKIFEGEIDSSWEFDEKNTGQIDGENSDSIYTLDMCVLGTDSFDYISACVIFNLTNVRCGIAINREDALIDFSLLYDEPLLFEKIELFIKEAQTILEDYDPTNSNYNNVIRCIKNKIKAITLEK